MELDEIVCDFERWFHDSERFDTTDARWAWAEDEMGRCAALIESAVLDELERRGFDVIVNHRYPDDEGPDVRLYRHRTEMAGLGTGPTRLHRLHAACKAALGGAR